MLESFIDIRVIRPVAFKYIGINSNNNQNVFKSKNLKIHLIIIEKIEIPIKIKLLIQKSSKFNTCCLV